MTSQDEELLADLLLQWEELRKEGVEPQAGDLARDRPDLVPELERRIRLLRASEWLDKPLEDPEDDDPPDEAPHVSRMLTDRYRLEELIAEGGFARVFRAFDVKLDRKVAVKVPKASRVESAKYFQAEAKRVAGLKHEGIVPVFDVGGEGDNCFIVTEYIDGGSLAEKLGKGSVEPPDAIRWVTEVGEALEYAHVKGVVHLDIKPANILLDSRGRARLADFGISLSAEQSGPFAPSLGTLRYMSPEQLEGEPADHRSDIYSLAVVLYELLSGGSPYSSVQPHLLRKEIVFGREMNLDNGLPSEVRKVIARGLSRSPNERPSSVSQFIGELHQAVRSGARRRTQKRLLAPLLLAGVIGAAPFVYTRLADQGISARQLPGQLIMSGIGSQKTLKGVVSPSWMQDGVFAEIKGTGVAKFPRVPASAFVLDLDLEMRNPEGLITFHSGEPGSAVELALGGLWPKDASQDKVPCRLFRIQPWGKNWIGDAYFPPKERILLTFVVNDEFKAVVRNKALVLSSSGDPADLCLTIRASENTDATIYRAVCRAITPKDAEEAEQPFSTRTLECDVAEARRRLASQIDAAWGESPVPGEPFVISDLELPLRWIEASEFTMGNPREKKPQFGAGSQRVRTSHGYWIGAYEVTQGQWQQVMTSNPSRITGSPYLPVNNISWSEAGAFCKKLTDRERRAGRCPSGYEYRLPTEAEWEFASRAGGDEPFVIPKNEIAMRDNRFPSIVEVGTTPPNAWGLHEVHGNLSEWCLDAWGDYGDDASTVVTDRYLKGSPETSSFVVRGNGFWMTEMAYTIYSRTRRRDLRGGFRGFRIVLGLSTDTLQPGRLLPEKKQP